MGAGPRRHRTTELNVLNSHILETAIGLVFVYLVFSLVASALAEYFSAYFDRRGEHLKHVLFNLFEMTTCAVGASSTFTYDRADPN